MPNGHDPSPANGMYSPREDPAALSDLVASARARPQDPVAWAELAGALARHDGSGPLEEELDLLLRDCLEHPGVEPQVLAPALAGHLRRLPALGSVIRRVEAGEAEDVLASPGAWRALSHPTVRCALENTVVPDLGIEALVQAARRHLALEYAGHDSRAQPDDEALVAALARNCYLTGYVHPCGDDELDAVRALAGSMDSRPLGDPDDPRRIALLGCYLPLVEWDRAPEVLELVQRIRSRPLAGLAKAQVLEPATEARLRGEIPGVREKADGTSGGPRTQDDTYPYPQWQRVQRLPPRSLATMLAEELTVAPAEVDGDNPKVLVVGCGTGKRVVETRVRLQGSEVTGLDPSRASLAYGIRKAREMNLQGVRFLQGTLPSLEVWGETFHVVDAVGSSPRLADLDEGWSVLLDRLLPGGLLKGRVFPRAGVGPVEAARTFLREQGPADDDDGVRAARFAAARFLRDVPEGASVLGLDGFYTLPGFRDLLLRPHERALTVSELAGLVRRSGVEFLGFVGVGPDVRRAFRRAHPNPASLTDLEAWVAFEEANPNAFWPSYRFWVRKPV